MSSAAQGVSPFGTWNGRDSFEIFPGVALHAIGGEQVVLCRVTYEPGKAVRRHTHEHTEQVMVIVDGEVAVTIGDEQRVLRALEAKAEPRREGKRVIFDEELSVRTVSSTGGKGFLDVGP